MVIRCAQIEPDGAGSRVALHTIQPLTNTQYLDMTYDGQVFYGLTASEVQMWQIDSASKSFIQVKSWNHGVTNAQGISTDGTTIFIIGN